MVLYLILHDGHHLATLDKDWLTINVNSYSLLFHDAELILALDLKVLDHRDPLLLIFALQDALAA